MSVLDRKLTFVGTPYQGDVKVSSAHVKRSQGRWRATGDRRHPRCMAFSGVFHSNRSGRSDAVQPPSREQVELRRCEVYRRAFPQSEIALPAYALRNRAVAKWARDDELAVDVRTCEELAVAIAMGIHPTRLTVHADGMTDAELRAAVHLAPGRVIVSSMVQIELLTALVEHRAQGVVVRVTDFAAPIVTVTGERRVRGFGFNTSVLDNAIAAILAGSRFNLVGLHCDIGSRKHDFVSFPAAIGHMITEMSRVRQRHGVVLTRVGLGGGGAVPSGDWLVELPEIATRIDTLLDDACATTRFARPMVVLSPGVGIVGQTAA